MKVGLRAGVGARVRVGVEHGWDSVQWVPEAQQKSALDEMCQFVPRRLGGGTRELGEGLGRHGRGLGRQGGGLGRHGGGLGRHGRGLGRHGGTWRVLLVNSLTIRPGRESLHITTSPPFLLPPNKQKVSLVIFSFPRVHCVSLQNQE